MRNEECYGHSKTILDEAGIGVQWSGQDDEGHGRMATRQVPTMSGSRGRGTRIEVVRFLLVKVESFEEAVRPFLPFGLDTRGDDHLIRFVCTEDTLCM